TGGRHPRGATRPRSLSLAPDACQTHGDSACGARGFHLPGDRGDAADPSRHRVDAASSRSPRIAQVVPGKRSMSTRCRRLWEVEAARDGGLTGSAGLAFEQHVKICGDCARERAALDDLKRNLVDASPPTDEIFLRRERDRLLAAADALGRAPARTPYVRWAVAAVAALVLSAGVWLGVRAKSAEPPADSYAVITPSAGTRWDRHPREGVDQIDLLDGTLSLVVHRSPSDPRLVIRVPDGEIEDMGTEFYVVVRESRTQEIAVQSGSVIF